MCNFFSFLSNGDGKYYYAKANDWDEFKKKDLDPHSHSSIAKFYLKNGKEDKLNAFEYNPLTDVFEIDKINKKNAKFDDSKEAEKWVKNLFKEYPQLVLPNGKQAMIAIRRIKKLTRKGFFKKGQITKKEIESKYSEYVEGAKKFADISDLKLEIIIKDWDAARGAARDAALFLCVQIEKKPKEKNFLIPLIELYEQGCWVIGESKGKFIIFRP